MKKRWNKKISRRKKDNFLTNLKNKFLALIYLVLIGTLLTLTFIIYNYLTKADDFLIKEVEICGKPTFSREQVEKILSFCKGKNIFKINLSYIKRRIEEDTGLGNILLEKDFPDRLIVRINERRVIARYKNVLVDYDGTTFKGRNHGVPAVIGPIEKGEIRVIASFLKRLRECDEGLYKRIQKIDYTNPRKVRISCKGWNLYWGGLKELPEDDIIIKINYLKKVLQDLQRKNLKIDYIDIRFFKKEEPSVIVKTI